MSQGMIDGEQWIAERLAFLKEILATEVSDSQKDAIEAEIQALKHERGIRQGGPRFLRWHPRRWLAPTRSRSTSPTE